jgi:glycosyltransferase involved in cell wall biosynthesis
VRVTHVITRLIVGGAQENTVASVLGLREHADLSVGLISGPTRGPEGSLEGRLAGLDVLTVLPQLVRPIQPWNDWRALQKLTEIFREQRPDLVHTHSGKAGILGRLAARRARVPIIVHTIHGPSFGSFQGGFANGIFRAVERYAARCTTHFVSVAEAMTRQYLDAGIGRAGQFTCIRSGFDLGLFLKVKRDPALRAKLGLTPHDVVVGMIGRLAPLKGHDELLAVSPMLVQKSAKMKFLLLGDGPLRARLEQQAKALSLEKHFVFTGLVPPQEVPHFLGAMDLVVHLSRREGLARALPQALVAGLPVMAYDLDGAGEVCLHERTGFLLPPGDRKQLTNRLLQLANDPGLRARFGQEGREFVQAKFSVERMVEELYELYRRLAKQVVSG